MSKYLSPVVGDPARGLEYNEMHNNRRISPGVWLVDLARSPSTERSFVKTVNVHAQVWAANSEAYRLNDKHTRVKGRIT